MSIPKGHGFDFTGGTTIGVTLNYGISLLGTLLGVVRDQDCHKQPYCEDSAEFLVLQLTCPSFPFEVGNIVAINIANIAVIGAGTAGCAD